jgi:thiamine biosynthesis lipoprotein
MSSTLTFPAMGTTITLRIDGASSARAQGLLASGQQFLEGFDAALSRFKTDSELSRVNADPSEAIELSWLMSEFVSAAIWAAEASGGLVDPTLTPALIEAGYAESRIGAASANLRLALEEAPPRRSANPDGTRRWRQLELDRQTRILRRPAGLTLDSGGSGKGLAADLLARNWTLALGANADFMIDCGGDIRFGPRGNRWGYVNVEDPFGGNALPLTGSAHAVATTSIRNRIWRREDGAPSHHLIDPSTGSPAWTGIVAVTAIAPTALVAETLTKIAFLRGPEGARDVLASADGGLIVGDNGTVEYVAPELQAVAA